MIRGDARRAVPAIVFLAALLGAATSLGHARALSSGETARLLARVEAIDGKCRFLDPADHDALKILAARAEVAAAGEGGPVEANAAVAAGRAEAAAAACDEASARLVRSAYGSAESAASGRPRRRVATAPPPDEVLPPLAAPDAGALDRYATRLVAYYLDLRCHHLTRPDAVRFWRSILQDQRSAARESGANAVAAAQSRARFIARRGWCGGNTARRVIDGYRGLAAR